MRLNTWFAKQRGISNVGIIDLYDHHAHPRLHEQVSAAPLAGALFGLIAANLGASLWELTAGAILLAVILANV